MKRITKKIAQEIRERVENNQPEMDWYGLDDARYTLKCILEKGIDEYLDELYDLNFEYICELENTTISNIQDEFSDYSPDEVERIVMDYICVDMNVKGLLNQLPDVTCILYVYSNYDCCNSFDTLEPDSYLWDAYQRTKLGVKKADFMHEFYNGAYGGSLFCFAFKTDIQAYLELRDEIGKGKLVKIPKGTQYGFFSSFQGAGSVFEKRTYRDMTIPVYGETEYDHLGITADEDQHYSLRDVYGSNDFIDEGMIEVIQ